MAPPSPNQGKRLRLTSYVLTNNPSAREWLRQALRSTGDQYPEFIAALSIVMGLAPEDAATQFEQRAEQVAASPRQRPR